MIGAVKLYNNKKKKQKQKIHIFIITVWSEDMKQATLQE